MKRLNASLAKIDSHTRSLIDPATARRLIALTGDAGIRVLEELAISLEQQRPIVPPLRPHLTESGDDPSRYGWLTLGGKSYRPDTEISYDAIDDMMRSAQVVFALAIKQAAIRSVLRNERSWKVRCDDEKIAEVVRGIMARTFRRSSHELMTYIPYGSAFFEKEWAYEPGPHWGISGKEGKFYGLDLHAIHPRSINRIEYRNKGRVFNGFVQNRTNGGEIVVRPDNALILTHGKMWRNLWGTPAMDIIYPYWFWLEVTMRAFMRYLERTGTPVTIVYAPMQGKITGSDGNEYDSIAYAMLQATYIANSNAAAFPSDVDPETGQKLWDVSYLADSNRGDQFVVAIERLCTMMTRGLVIGDRTASQEGAVGSFAMSQVHYNVTQQHNEWLLDELLRQINDYVVEQIVRYNGTSNTPPALIETEGLDPEEKNRLFNLLNTMGNQAGGEALKQIDWEAICDINNIPTLTQEQVDELYERELERTKERNEALAATAGPQGTPPGGEKPEGPKKSVTQEPVKNSVEWLQYQLSQGAMVPAIISKDIAEQIEDYGRNRPFVVSLFNPYHDEMGRFAPKPGSSGISYSEIGAAADKIVDHGFAGEVKEWAKEHKRELIAAGIIVGVVGATVGLVALDVHLRNSASAPNGVLTHVLKGSDYTLNIKTFAPRGKSALDAVSPKASAQGVKLIHDAFNSVRENGVKITGERNIILHPKPAALPYKAWVENRWRNAFVPLKNIRSTKNIQINSEAASQLFSGNISSPAELRYILQHEMVHARDRAVKGIVQNSVIEEGLADYIGMKGARSAFPDFKGKYVYPQSVARVLSIAENMSNRLGIGMSEAIARMLGLRRQAASLKRFLEFSEQDTIKLFNPYHDELGRFAPKPGGAGAVSEKAEPFAPKGADIAVGAARIGFVGKVVATIAEVAEGVVADEYKPALSAGKRIGNLVASAGGTLSAASWAAVHGRLAVVHTKDFFDQVRIQLTYKGKNKKARWDRAKDLFNHARKAVGFAAISSLDAAKAIVAGSMFYSSTTGKRVFVDDIVDKLKSIEPLAGIVDFGWAGNMASLFGLGSMMMEDQGVEVFNLVQDLSTIAVACEVASGNNLDLDVLFMDLDKDQIDVLEKSLIHFFAGLSAYSTSLSWEEGIALFNPYHDELGRFAEKPGGAVSDLALAGDIALRPNEKERLQKNISALGETLGHVSGTYKGKVHPLTNMDDWVKMKGFRAIYVAGAANPESGDIYINPVLTASLAGRRSRFLTMGVSDTRVLADSTIVHEMLHTRNRKSGTTNPGMMEEGCTEILTLAAMKRSGTSMGEIYRTRAYSEAVFSLAKEARTRYPKSPNDAIKFIGDLHHQGITDDTVGLAFGGKYASDGRVRKLGGNIANCNGNWRDLVWLFGEDESFKLEEDQKDGDAVSGIYQKLLDGDFAAVVEEMEKELTPEIIRVVGEFIEKSDDRTAQELIAEIQKSDKLREIYAADTEPVPVPES